MNDLTKLTAKELRSRFVRLPHDWSLGGRSSMQAQTEEWDEIWLRVERLEEAEYVAQKALETAARFEKRLEKCEMALRKARTLLISEGDPDEDREMIAEIDELLGDAARAEVEGK